MISLEAWAQAISETANQNGFTARWEWAGEVVNVQFTRTDGSPGPQLTLRRNNLQHTVGELDGKNIGPWGNDPNSFAWGRFWRAVRQSGRVSAPKVAEFGRYRR